MQFIYFFENNEKSFQKNIVICIKMKFSVFLQIFDKYFCFFSKITSYLCKMKITKFYKNFEKDVFLKNIVISVKVKFIIIFQKS